MTPIGRLWWWGKIRIKDCKSQKTGKSYDAVVCLSAEEDGRAKFCLEFEGKDNSVAKFLAEIFLNEMCNGWYTYLA